MADELPVEQFAGSEEFRAWLADNHATAAGVWLRLAKKGASFSTVTRDEAVGAALAYGWIDGQASRLDDASYLQRFTPRRSRSPWSQRNRRRAEAMIDAGEMEPSGLAEVERAKSDGRWDRAYEGPRNAEAPADFLAALEQDPAAKASYASLNSQNRYAIYYRLQEAKRPETRERRIEKFVAMLARGETLH